MRSLSRVTVAARTGKWLKVGQFKLTALGEGMVPKRVSCWQLFHHCWLGCYCRCCPCLTEIRYSCGQLQARRSSTPLPLPPGKTNSAWPIKGGPTLNRSTSSERQRAYLFWLKGLVNYIMILWKRTIAHICHRKWILPICTSATPTLFLSARCVKRVLSWFQCAYTLMHTNGPTATQSPCSGRRRSASRRQATGTGPYKVIWNARGQGRGIFEVFKLWMVFHLRIMYVRLDVL